MTRVRRRLSSSSNMVLDGCSSTAFGPAGVARVANGGGEELKRRWPWVAAGKRKKKEKRKRRGRRCTGKEIRGVCGQSGTDFPQFLIGQSLI